MRVCLIKVHPFVEERPAKMNCSEQYWCSGNRCVGDWRAVKWIVLVYCRANFLFGNARSFLLFLCDKMCVFVYDVLFVMFASFQNAALLAHLQHFFLLYYGSMLLISTLGTFRFNSDLSWTQLRYSCICSRSGSWFKSNKKEILSKITSFTSSKESREIFRH